MPTHDFENVSTNDQELDRICDVLVDQLKMCPLVPVYSYLKHELNQRGMSPDDPRGFNIMCVAGYRCIEIQQQKFDTIFEHLVSAQRTAILGDMVYLAARFQTNDPPHNMNWYERLYRDISDAYCSYFDMLGVEICKQDQLKILQRAWKCQSNALSELAIEIPTSLAQAMHFRSVLRP